MHIKLLEQSIGIVTIVIFTLVDSPVVPCEDIINNGFLNIMISFKSLLINLPLLLTAVINSHFYFISWSCAEFLDEH